MADKDFSYFHQGIEPVETDSSLLVSSSKYLNHAGLRDWMVTHFLRRNGPDRPVPSDTTSGLVQALWEMRDPDHFAALVARERTLNPPFADWLDARYLSPLTREDFARYAPGTLGGEFHKYLVEMNLALNLGGGNANPANDVEYIFARMGQIHDYEHLVTGGEFTSLGEIIPFYVRMSNTWQHFTAPMAHALSEVYLFGGHRMVIRGNLHYPTAWLTIVDLMRRGINIGLASANIVTMKYEDALHLPLVEARAYLGIHNAEDIDTRADDAVFLERRLPTEEELARIGRPDLAAIRTSG